MALVDAAKALVKDNRTVVGGKADTGAEIAAVPLLAPTPTGLLSGVDRGGAAAETVVEAVKDVSAAHVSDPQGVATVTVALDKTKARKNFFKDKTGDPSSGKWCWVNKDGWPLKADGTKAVGVSDAADAKTTPLTAVGEAVTDYTQRPLPGTYTVSVLAQGTSPYIGWTAQK